MLDQTQVRKDPMLGSVLGDYQVLERIGEGGMGIVYRGVQPVIQKRVAIKVLRPDAAGDPSQAERLTEEALAVNAIGHRGIVDIFGIGSVPDGRRYVVMEYLEGESLELLLGKRAPMDAGEALPLLEEVCGVLTAAHGAGVIHRDLKPGNVFVVRQPDGSRYVKLLDFGLAKRSAMPGVRTAQTSNARVVGTPDCMAPEQARGLEVSAQSDLYSLGVMMFEMFTGKLPFIAPTAIEVLMRHVDTPPPVPSSLVSTVPPPIEALILRLLEKDPAARPASAEEVRQELSRIGRELQSGAPLAAPAPIPLVDAAGPGASATPPELALPSARPPSQDVLDAEVLRGKRPLLVVFGGVAALLMVVGVALFEAGKTPAPRPEPKDAPAVVVEHALAGANPDPIEPKDPERPVPVVVAPDPDPAPAPEPKVEPRPSHATAEPVRPTRPERDTAPPPKALEQRIEKLEKRLRAASAPDEPDPTALKLLDRWRIQVTVAKTPADRRKIAGALDEWRRTFLRQ